MPKAAVYDMTGKEVGEIELSDSVFGIEPNKTVLHDVVVNYLANQRQGTQSTLTRSEVSADASPGSRRAPAMQGRARSALRNGSTAVWRSARSRATTAIR